MPIATTYPGVYVEEIPSGVRTITGVSTSDTAFIDFFGRGSMNTAVRVTSMEEFNRRFGGLHVNSEASYAISQFYLNGGSIAWVVRVASGDPVTAQYRFAAGGSPAGGELVVDAANPGLWAKDHVQVAVDQQVRAGGTGLFNLAVRELDEGKRRVVATEVHRNVSMNPTDSRYVKAVVAADSTLVRIASVGTGGPPAPSTPNANVTGPDVLADVTSTAFKSLGDPTFGDNAGKPVTDGTTPDRDALVKGLDALKVIAPNVFNILCLPAASQLSEDAMDYVIDRASKLCLDARAFLIVDPHKDTDMLDEPLPKKSLATWLPAHGDALRNRNAAMYFPRVDIPDPLNEGRPRTVGPSGTVAGVYARIDANRGVWKAPAGADDGKLVGVTLPLQVTDLQNGQFNPLGINLLRTFPIYGNVIWGARTLDGADRQASEWKYVPVRRTALFIEESLSQGLKWVVFEPNDEPLWSQIRLNVGAFMHDLFRLGAFQGATPREAYFVKCDSETTTQTDIDHGVVNILVGFAPLKPAEFVVIQIQQMAGQLAT
jgi:Bacteriophage tail sheath protein